MGLQKPREIAFNVLEQRESGRAFVEQLLDDALEKVELKREDRGLVQELVYGVARWQLTLDWMIAQKTGDRPQRSAVQNLLRMALYQMFWLERVPSYAAVNESVAIAKGRGLTGQAKFINAVLRAYGREAEAVRVRLEEFKATNPALGYSHPEWLCRRWEERWGKAETKKLLEWNNAPGAVYARANSLRTTPADLEQRWTAEGVSFEPASFDWIKGAKIYRLLKHPSVGELPSFREGGWYVQDPSTLLAPGLLGPETGEAILDLCAAPGGKTTFLAQLINNQGRILAQDLDPARLKLVKENCARLGAECVTTDEKAFPADSTFDRVLLDAPCSNTGVMRRRIELRWRVTPEEILRLARTQGELLKRAAARTRIGGVLVYSTCSLEREENEAVTRDFLSTHTRFALESERALTPFRDGVDGAYCAVLRRTA